MSSSRLRTALAACVILAAAPVAAFAQTYDFTYTGTATSIGGLEGVISAMGTGSFTVNGSGQATAFSLDLSQMTIYGTDVFDFGLGDLESFQAQVTNGQLTGLSFYTDQLPAVYDIYTAFNVIDLMPGDSESFDYDTGPLTVGSLTFAPTSVPEPAAAVLFGVGLLGVAATRRRVRRG